MKRFTCVAVAALASLLVGCASSSPTVDMKEPRRVVGTESDVRVDAEVYGDSITSGGSVAVKYAVTNLRSGMIAIADLLPETTYDPETQMVTVEIGTEVPGDQFLPRLILVKPGEKKSFATNARIMFISSQNPLNRSAIPRALRLKVNFLNETQPFVKLIDIPEKAVHDPQLAADLFPKWVDRNESVITSSLPMHWGVRDMGEPVANQPTATGRRGRVPPRIPGQP